MPDSAVRRSIGEQIRKARGERSRAWLANELDVPWKYVWRWETGETEPRPETRARIAEALGVSVADLFTEEAA
jgi:ribosome-binding protein aMBF1 (putative translation factor)